MRQRPAPGAGIGMVVEVQPHPERVVGRQQDAQPVVLAEREEVVPELHHVGHEGAGRTLEIAVAHLRVFHHQAQHGDAVTLQHGEVSVDGRDIAAAKQRVELDPADRVVLADRVPVGAPVLDEIGRAFGDPDPGQRCGAGRAQRTRCGRDCLCYLFAPRHRNMVRWAGTIPSEGSAPLVSRRETSR